MPLPSAVTRDRFSLKSKLIIVQGCADSIAADSRNTPDARAKGRIIAMHLDEIRDLLDTLLAPPPPAGSAE